MRKPVVPWYAPFFYRLICSIADAVDMLVLAISPDTTPSVSLQPSEADGMSDEALLELLEYGINIGSTTYQFDDAPNIVMKVSQDMQHDPRDAAEANALDLLFAKTKIPVPRVRRVIPHDIGNIIVMDHIRGETLAKVWQTFSLWKKTRLAFILRRYVRQLRQLKVPAGEPPGPLSLDASQPRECECPPIFGDVRSSRGPFATYEELSAYMNKCHRVAYNTLKDPENYPERNELFDDSAPLVLSHMDLNPRNIILGEDGRLWIIDWAWAGYYPVWFEYVSMFDRVHCEETWGWQDRFWELMVPFVCGPFFNQAKWVYSTRIGFYYTR